ncbi:MAG: CvpA family protein [Bacilli bacterium]|nr:CvpA family protein [Bacilli bacterium]
MNLNFDFTNPKVIVVNLVIIIFLLISIYDGYKKGLFESFFNFLGFILSCIIAFTFKNKLSVIMYTYLPFFKFGGALKGITAINILLYELLAFIAIFIVCMIIVSLILKMTNLIEKLVKALPLIGFVDQLLGALVGLAQSVVILYFIIFVFKFGCNLFGFYVQPSLADNIMEIPFLKEKCGPSLEAFDDIVVLKDDYDSSEKEEFNNKAIKILLDKNIITKDNLDLLIKKNKIKYTEN